MPHETILITGASAGIGRELAHLFAADKSHLLLVARSEDRLRELAGEVTARYGTQTLVFPADLARPEAAQALVNRLDSRGITVDVLVNNAGFGAVGRFAELDEQQQADMMHVNVLAPTQLARLLLLRMIQRGRGGVLNVASTAAFQPGPNMAVYYASKAFVLHFTEALAEELRGTGVKATCLAPGPTATEFAERAELSDALLFNLGTMSAASVARAGYRGFRRGKMLVVPGVRNRLLASMVRFLPRALVRKVVKRLHS
jgi:hypothetical protein